MLGDHRLTSFRFGVDVPMSWRTLAVLRLAMFSYQAVRSWRTGKKYRVWCSTWPSR